MLTAIKSGVVPGNFTADRTTFTFPTINYRGARGKVHSWTVAVSLETADTSTPTKIKDKMLDQPAYDLSGYRAVTLVESLQEGGKIRDVVPTYTTVGKRLGTKAETNCLTQAIRDALGKYNKQNKRNEAVDGPAAAVATADPAAADARPPPMLVKRFGKKSGEVMFTSKDYTDGITLQRKFNGVRYVAAYHNGDVTPYSRTGTIYPGQAQIISEIKELLRGVDKSPYLDGELYLHGKSLNWISGQARKGDDAGILEYHIYDVFFPDNPSMPSRARQAYLDKIFLNGGHPHIKRVENFSVRNESEMIELSKQFVSNGYEGAIARRDAAPYQYGYRNLHSSNLLKIKPTYDAEFIVVGFTQGTKGKDVGALIWICEVHPDNIVDPDDTIFTVVPKDMSYEERKDLFQQLSTSDLFERKYKGVPLTVEYSEISTKTGKPLQAKALAFRNYE